MSELFRVPKTGHAEMKKSYSCRGESRRKVDTKLNSPDRNEGVQMPSKKGKWIYMAKKSRNDEANILKDKIPTYRLLSQVGLENNIT